METDDSQRGHVLTRRQALALLGTTGALILGKSSAALGPILARAPAAAPPSPGTAPAGASIVRPAQTEGPYFVDELLNRSDIRSDPADGTVKPGAELRLTLNVTGLLASGTCVPLAGVYVDVWHTDALGVYSDVQDPGFNTVGKKFLRGYQVTDAAGTASFTTIYPGWY